MRIILIITLLLFSFGAKANKKENEEVNILEEGCSHNYSILSFNDDNNQILYKKRADNIIYPASLVKLMTLYLTFEALENKKITATQKLKASQRAVEVSRVNRINTLHLTFGEELTVRQAIRALIVKSFNEAAIMLAEAISGSEWEFAKLMNKKASELGMNHSSFKNASGLHSEGQYTTVYDLARLVKAIKKDFRGYYHLFSLKEFEYNDKKYTTHNHVLLDYEGAEGMKTGFTRASGFNLISIAKHNGSRVVAVLASCASHEKRDELMQKLLDLSFEKINSKKAFDITLAI